MFYFTLFFFLFFFSLSLPVDIVLCLNKDHSPYNFIETVYIKKKEKIKKKPFEIELMVLRGEIDSRLLLLLH